MKLSKLIEALDHFQSLCDDPDVEFKDDTMIFQATNITLECTTKKPLPVQDELQDELQDAPQWEELLSIHLEEI